MIISEPVKVEKVAIAIKNLPAYMSAVKIVQLSDLHYDGIHLDDSTLRRAISLSNEAEPDLVVITGDEWLLTIPPQLLTDVTHS